MTDPIALLRDAENYLSALHGSVARHDHLAANLACAGCELRDRIAAALPELAAVSSAVVAPPTDHTTDSVREQLLQALDFSACLHLGYTTPEELLAAYDASRTPTSDRATTLTEIERKMLEYALALAQDKIWSLDGFTDEDQAAVTSLRRLADETPDGEPGCAHCGSRDHAWDDCEAYTELAADDEPVAGARQDGAAS